MQKKNGYGLCFAIVEISIGNNSKLPALKGPLDVAPPLSARVIIDRFENRGLKGRSEVSVDLTLNWGERLFS